LTSQRKLGLSSGAPPVMSTVVMPGLAASSCIVRRATLAGMISVSHLLRAFGPGVDVAVMAGLVAQLAHIDL
jgi:hypothetical protein